MTVVLDSCAAVEIALRRPEATRFAGFVADADWTIAPSLFIPEVTNTFWKYHRIADMPIDQCEAALDRTIALVDDFHDIGELARESLAMAVRTGKSAYDMFFLVLARRHDALLLTLDQALRKTCEQCSVRVVG